MNLHYSNRLDQFFSYLSFLDLDPSQEKWSENFMACKSKSALPSANRVYIPNNFTQQDLLDLEKYFGKLPFTIWLDNNNQIGNESLQKKGFKPHITYPLMVANLNHLPEYYKNPAIKVNRIISNDKILTLWVSLVSAAYNNISIVEFRKLISYFLSTTNPENIHFYIGYYNNHPCSTSMLIIRNGVADIHWVGTLPEYRKKGIGYAITCSPLHEIKNSISQAILYASVMGKPLYEQMGFVEEGASLVYQISDIQI